MIVVRKKRISIDGSTSTERALREPKWHPLGKAEL
jgi:hypothetical protein